MQDARRRLAVPLTRLALAGAAVTTGWAAVASAQEGLAAGSVIVGAPTVAPTNVRRPLTAAPAPSPRPPAARPARVSRGLDRPGVDLGRRAHRTAR
jgi:hypothetical protein